MAHSEIGKKTKQGIVWNTVTRLAGTFGQFIGTVVLARLLAPEDFGLVATGMLIIGFSTRFGQFGFHMGLIQRKEDITKEHINSLFMIDLTFKTILWFAVYFLTPFIAHHFSNPRLLSVMPVIALYMVFECFSTTPLTVLKRELDFKSSSLIDTAERFANISSSILLAALGFGVWSLILSNLAGQVCSAVLAMRKTRWFPSFRLSLEAARDLFRFGILIFMRNLFRYGADNVDYYWVGKILGAGQLGLYEKAFVLMRLPQKRITRAVNKVVFSAFSRIQDEPERIRRAFCKLILSVTLVSYPMLAGMAFIAPVFVPVVLGQKWVGMVLPLQIMCIAGLLRSMDPFLNSVLTTTGFVKSTVTRRGFELILLTITTYFGVRFGIVGVSIAVVASSIVIMFLMVSIITANSSIKWRDYFYPQVPGLLSSAIMVAAMFLVEKALAFFIHTDGLVMLMAMVVTGALSYFAVHYLVRFPEVVKLYDEIEGDIRSVLQKMKQKIMRTEKTLKVGRLHQENSVK